MNELIQAQLATTIMLNGPAGPKTYVVVADHISNAITVQVLEKHSKSVKVRGASLTGREDKGVGEKKIDAYAVVAQITTYAGSPGSTASPAELLGLWRTPDYAAKAARFAYDNFQTAKKSGEQATEEFFFRLIPTMSARLDYADYQETGDHGKLLDAGVALAGDVALFTGVGAAGKVGTGAAVALRTGQVVELSIALVQGSRAIADFLSGDTEAGVAHAGEATLMLIGFTAAEIQSLRAAARAKSTANGVVLKGRSSLVRAFTAAEYDEWLSSLPTRPAPTTRAGMYQRKYAGPIERQASGGGEAFFTDGIEQSTIVETKLVMDPQKSPFIAGSDAPPFIRAAVRKDLDNEFRRMAVIIQDPNNPLKSVEVIVNDARAVPLFQDLLKQHYVPGIVVVKPE